MPRSLKSKSCSWRIRKIVKTFSSAPQWFLNATAAYLPVVGAVQIVGHGWILCCQCVNLRWERRVILRSACSSSHRQSHLFDPGLDAMIQPQPSGFSLAGAQNLANLTVREAVLFGLQQQLRWYRNTAVRRGNYWTQGLSKHRIFVIYKTNKTYRNVLKPLFPSMYLLLIYGNQYLELGCHWLSSFSLFSASALLFSDRGISIISIIAADNGSTKPPLWRSERRWW